MDSARPTHAHDAHDGVADDGGGASDPWPMRPVDYLPSCLPGAADSGWPARADLFAN